MSLIIVSACLAGVNCKYNGKNNLCKRIQSLVSQGNAIPLCPEQLGGCPTPRTEAEVSGGTGADVLDGKCRVINREGIDVTDYFIRGAQEVLQIAKLMGVQRAILKSKSPSCGFGQIYDGSFSGTLIKGNGITSELLIRNGILVEEDKG